MKNKKGISLIVLIVTIIVIIILAAAVILTLSKNNPIESAREATFKEDVRAFQDELALSVSKEYVEKQGQRDQKITETEFDKIKKYIPSFTKKYDGKFVIENDKLVGTDKLTEKENEWCENLQIKTTGDEKFNAKEWDKTASPDECFIWDGTTIVGYNEEPISGLTTLRIPSKCTAIRLEYGPAWSGYRDFVGGIAKVEIPDTVTEIGDYAFLGFKFEEIIIPDSVITIGSGAFTACTELSNIKLSNNLKTIGNSAFYSDLFPCKNLTSIVIPSSVETIGSSAFSGCTKLTSVTIPEGVTSIGNGAFNECTSLTSITIPEGVTSIGNNAFQNCSSLLSITIPSGVTSIGEFAFNECTSLTSITIPEGVTIISDYAFEECTSLTNITIPSTVTSIGLQAFYQCSSLTNITIPDSVKSIGVDAFYNTAYYNNSANWENNVLYINNHLIDAKENISGEYIIKAGTKSLAVSAFSGCTKLTSVIIPDSITRLTGFNGCTKLTSITIPESVTSIAGSAFSDCSSLTNITIPDSVKSIGYRAFYNTAYYNNSANWENNVLYLNNNLIDAKDNISGEYIIKYGTKCLAREAFNYCKSLTSITIPEGVVSIETNTFRGCKSLTSVIIQKGVTSIGSWAFGDCSKLTSITIPNSITSIDSCIFANCYNLTNINFEGTISEWNNISKNAEWNYLSSITNITCTDGTINL